MRRRLVENGIFPVCRRCCKVELSPDAGRRAVRRRRAAPGAARDSADGGPVSHDRCSGAQTLLINPPLINGVAFTRQGRCQEREDVLGTTKPPYTLALAAALLRERGLRRPADRRHRRAAVDRRRDRARSSADGFAPTLILFPEHDADARRRRRRDGAAQGAATARRCSASARTPRRCRRESMERAPAVDGMFVGEPEDGDAAAGARSSRSTRSATSPA